VIGLAHQVMLPLVAEPLAAGALDGLDPLLDGLLPHAAAVSAAVTPKAVISMTRDLPRIAATTFMVLSFSSLSCHVTCSFSCYIARTIWMFASRAGAYGGAPSGTALNCSRWRPRAGRGRAAPGDDF
jgi:hypothetical protein